MTPPPRRGPGRPRSGRIGYMVHVKPEAMQAARNEAKRRGLKHVGELIEQDYGKPYRPALSR
jgi:hypothetical protein